MAYDCIQYEKADRIAKVILNRPEKLNALSPQLQQEYVQALKEAEADPEVHVVIVKGAGRAFSAGYDITPSSAYGQTARRRDIMEDDYRLKATVARWMTAWYLRKPVIAQIHGYCLAGATDCAFCCDIVVAADDTQIGHPGIRSLGMPLTQMYPYNLGPQRAKLMLLSGDPITGKQAEEWGFVAKAVPADKLDETVMAIATRLSLVPIDLVTLNKHAVNRVFENMGLRESQDAACEMDAIAHMTEGVLEFNRIREEKGLKAALEWRDKPFQDYRGGR